MLNSSHRILRSCGNDKTVSVHDEDEILETQCWLKEASYRRHPRWYNLYIKSSKVSRTRHSRVAPGLCEPWTDGSPCLSCIQLTPFSCLKTLLSSPNQDSLRRPSTSLVSHLAGPSLLRVEAALVVFSLYQRFHGNEQISGIFGKQRIFFSISYVRSSGYSWK